MPTIMATRRIALVLLLCGLVSTPVAAEPLSLQASVARALAENPQLKASALGVDEASEDVSSAWGDFLPTLGLSYGRNKMSNDSSSERDTNYLDQRNNSSTVTLSQSLFSGFSGVAGVKRSNLVREYQELQLRTSQAQMVREIRRDFYTVLQAQALLELWDAAIKRLERQKEIANAWYERQLATRLRLLEVEVELSSAALERDAARSGLATARARMAHWLALSTPDELHLDGSLEEVGVLSFPPLAECLEIAFRERPELKVANVNIGVAEQDKVQVASRSLPKVDLEGSWTDYTRKYENGRYQDDRRDYYNVNLRVSVQPFQGGKNIYAWRRQGLTVEKLRQQQLETTKAIDTEVRTAFSQWQDSEARLAASADALRQATEAWEFAERAMELGVLSLRDLLDAELRRTRAEITRLEALQYRQRCRTELAYAIGEPGADR
ncbi:MAG: TolC family protein [Desulfobulbaceae bacterium]|nr:TolC family protein [Desulfobulbaceae bacterium]